MQTFKVTMTYRNENHDVAFCRDMGVATKVVSRTYAAVGEDLVNVSIELVTH